MSNLWIVREDTEMTAYTDDDDLFEENWDDDDWDDDDWDDDDDDDDDLLALRERYDRGRSLDYWDDNVSWDDNYEDEDEDEDFDYILD